MRRIIISIILGLIIPVSCLIGLGVADTYRYLPESLMRTTFYGETAPGILLAPFTLTVYLGIFLKAEKILPAFLDTFWMRFLSAIVFDWALFGLITYFFLSHLKKSLKRSIVASDTPPPPPEFEK